MGNSEHFTLEHRDGVAIVRLCSVDVTNRLTRACVEALTEAIRRLATAIETGSTHHLLKPKPGLGGAPTQHAESTEIRGLILTGNEHFFSAGAELAEIVALDGPAAYTFSLMGQALMDAIDRFPAPVSAAVRGYCMGGGLDLALACDVRLAHPHAIFGHRGAALGLITGWGGTQRLSRLVGKAKALEMFVAAEKLTAAHALEFGLVQEIVEDPVGRALQLIAGKTSSTGRTGGR